MDRKTFELTMKQIKDNNKEKDLIFLAEFSNDNLEEYTFTEYKFVNIRQIELWYKEKSNGIPLKLPVTTNISLIKKIRFRVSKR